MYKRQANQRDEYAYGNVYYRDDYCRQQSGEDYPECTDFSYDFTQADSDSSGILWNLSGCWIYGNAGQMCIRDRFMVDVTGIPGVKEETPVTLIGSDQGEEITVEELAELCGDVYKRQLQRRAGAPVPAADWNFDRLYGICSIISCKMGTSMEDSRGGDGILPAFPLFSGARNQYDLSLIHI